jgi:hypothetical protein
MRPSEDNRRKLEAALAKLEKKANEVEALYKEQTPILTAAAMRRYAEEVRAAVKGLGQGGR